MHKYRKLEQHLGKICSIRLKHCIIFNANLEITKIDF
jgi:hypothetical protein